MSGIGIEIDFSALDRVAKQLGDQEFDRDQLLDEIGALVTSQTQDRIANTKTAPDGTRWAPNRRGGSELVLKGHLLTSIHHEVADDQVQVGSNLVYAAIHQFGGEIKPKNAKALHFRIGNMHFAVRKVTMPARPFLGFSGDNIADIEALVADFITERLQ